MEPQGADKRNFAVLVASGILAAVLASLLVLTRDWRGAWEAAVAAAGDGRRIKVEPMVATCVWWSGVAAAAMAALAGLLTLPAWRAGRDGWLGPRRVAGLLPAASPLPRWFWPAMAVVLLLAAGLRAPRMGLSFYNDESHAYVRLIAGEWKDLGEPKEKFRQPGWVETAYRNSTGNNGFLFSILGRLGHDTWQSASGAPDGVVREWPVRLPSLLAGLLTVLVLALVPARLGYPLAGLAAAVLLAVHPWHVRYSTEARGYALMMLAMAAGYFFMARAMRTGRWSDWVAHGVVQFIALWAYPGAMIAVALGQMGAGCLLGWQAVVRPAPGAGWHFFRWAGGGAVAVLLAAFFLLPGMIQLREQLAGNPSMVGQVLPGWWLDTLVYLANGCGWAPAAPANPVNPYTAGHVLRIAGAAGFHLLVLGGLWSAWKEPKLRFAVVLAVLQVLALGPLYLRSVLSANVLLWWYALSALPGLVLLAAMAFRTSAGARLAGTALVCVLASAATVLPAVMRHGKSDGRELVRLARGGDFREYDKRPITMDLWSDAVTYDPMARWVESPEALRQATEKAAAAGVPLFVYVGHEGKALFTHPEVLRALQGSGEFELVATAWGLESDVNDNRLYRWKGDSSGGR